MYERLKVKKVTMLASLWIMLASVFAEATIEAKGSWKQVIFFILFLYVGPFLLFGIVEEINREINDSRLEKEIASSL